jgi:hypothetical protein
MSFINMCYTILSKKNLKIPKGVLRSHKSKDGQHNSQRKKQRLIGSYTSPYWRSGISSTSVRNSVFSRVERSGTSGKTLNFSHEWKKSQIFNKDECKYLFLPFQLKNKACRFHSFIRMSMSCLLHKILQRHVQCSKYTLI